MDDDYLKGISDSIGQAAKAIEARRAEHNVVLSSKLPLLFQPDSDDARFGTGYFLFGEVVLAYRRMANGYELHPCMSFDVSTIEMLYQGIVMTRLRSDDGQ
jgi:hypothetical protein